MPSNNSKYSEEMRERTSKFIIESGKSATSVAEELGIDINTVCRWVRDYRRKHKMPSYSDEKGIVKGPKVEKDENWLKIKELEKELKIKNKQLEEEKEKVEILKKSLHIGVYNLNARCVVSLNSGQVYYVKVSHSSYSNMIPYNVILLASPAY